MPVTRLAACHADPVFLDAQRTVDKALRLIKTAASHDANVIAFPESFIPGFPFWSAIRAPAENHDLFARMAKSSVEANGEEMRAIRAAAAQHRVVISMGFSERAPSSIATLYNSNMLYGPDGSILAHHRKLVPTFFEKLTWSPGDGAGLKVADTPHGRIGQLICGENTNPLARYALMAQGEQIHISSWPAVWPTRFLADGDSSAKNYDNVAANRTRTAAHCFEAKCFGVMCAAVLDESAIAITAEGAQLPELVRDTMDRAPRGATMFLDPTGSLLPGFVVDQAGKKTATNHLQDKEDILYADAELDQCIEGKQYHDVSGGYQRFDVFSFQVNRDRQEPIMTIDGDQDDINPEQSKDREKTI